MAMSFSFENTSVTLRRPELEFEMYNSQGVFGRFLRLRGMLMVAAAKQKVGVDTGRLKDSIHMRITREALGQRLEIGTRGVEYALAHHEGTPPRVILPNEANILRFSSGGRIVYTRHVEHPGTKPNKFLSSQLYLIRL